MSLNNISPEKMAIIKMVLCVSVRVCLSRTNSVYASVNVCIKKIGVPKKCPMPLEKFSHTRAHYKFNANATSTKLKKKMIF